MSPIDRRGFIVGAAAVSMLGPPAMAAQIQGAGMYGLIGKMTAKPGQRDALIAAILGDGYSMPGCLSYVVARDAEDPDGIWITEVWDSEASHKASLSLPEVKAAIAKARPLFAGMDKGVTTEPVGGIGLPSRTPR
jgi:quinol monooxygenase YgiN